MNDAQATALFHAAGDPTTIGPAPQLDDLFDEFIEVRRRRRLVRFLQVVSVAAVIGLLFVGSTLLPQGRAGSIPAHRLQADRSLVVVPDVVGLPQIIAIRVFRSAGLRLTGTWPCLTHRLVSCPAPLGLSPVAGLHPSAGTALTPGAAVKVTLGGRTNIAHDIIGTWRDTGDGPVRPYRARLTFGSAGLWAYDDGCETADGGYVIVDDGTFDTRQPITRGPLYPCMTPDPRAAVNAPSGVDLVRSIKAVVVEDGKLTAYNWHGHVVITMTRVA